MSAYPNIIDAVGSYDPSIGVTTGMVLFTNSGGNGYIIGSIYDSETRILKNTREKCFNAKVGLAYKLNLEFSGDTNHIDMSVGNCPSGEGCDPPSCPGVNITGRLNDMPVYMADYSTPPSPAGLNVYSGDKSLKFTWTKNSNIFAYYLVLADPSGNPVTLGFLPNYVGEYTFEGLTNGVAYTLHIYNINQSNTPSSEMTKTGVPSGITTPTPTVTPTVTPTIPPTTTPPGGGGGGISVVVIAGSIIGLGALAYLLSRKE